MCAKSPVDKRKDLRVELYKPFAVKLHIKKNKGLSFFSKEKLSSVDNMSVGGMRLELPLMKRSQMERIIDGREKIVLELGMPSSRKTIKITGKLVWLKRKDKRGKTIYVVGLNFPNINDSERESILQYLMESCLKDGCNIS